MSKCKTCELRYVCKGMQQFNCENGDYKDYIPDGKAVEEELNEIFDVSVKYDKQKDEEIERLKRELAEVKSELRKVCSSVMKIKKTERTGQNYVEYKFCYDNRLSNASAGEIASILLRGFIEADERKRKS